jgi:uncharacterized protein YjbJ (UPF0337 family)
MRLHSNVFPVGESNTHEPCEGSSLKGNRPMNWDRMEGEWKQQRGKAVHHWGKMMNDELAAIAGKYEELVGRLQERYGIASEKSKRQVDDFKKIVVELKKSNARLMGLQARHKNAKSSPAKIKPGKSTRTIPRSKVRG